MKDFNKALKYSFLLLKYRERSKNELIFRLKKKGYSFSLAKEVLNYLEDNNYVNDKKFVDSFVSYSLQKGWGPRRIDFNLKKLGISFRFREQALQGQVYSDRIREIAQKRSAYYRKIKPSLSKKLIYQRIIRVLTAKGFDYEDIFREMQNLGLGSFEN